MYSWYQNIFHVIAVLIVFFAANEKNGEKKLKQDSNSRQRQDIVPVCNMKARKIKTIFLLPIHLAHHPIADAAVAPLLLSCRAAISLLSIRYCSDVSLLLSLLLSLRNCSCYCLHCRSAVAPLSLRYCSAVAPLSLFCRFYRNVAASVNPAVATLSLLLSLLMSLHCHSFCHYCVALVSLYYRSVISPPSLRC